MHTYKFIRINIHACMHVCMYVLMNAYLNINRDTNPATRSGCSEPSRTTQSTCNIHEYLQCRLYSTSAIRRGLSNPSRCRGRALHAPPGREVNGCTGASDGSTFTGRDTTGMTFWPPRNRESRTDTMTLVLVPTSTPCNRSWNVARPRWSNLQQGCFCVALVRFTLTMSIG
jgi:hypothetical protein